ncbi:MAG: ATP-binding protein, partial [Lentisphaeria bacterium]
NIVNLKLEKSTLAECIEKIVKPHCELMQIKKVDNGFAVAKDYSLEGINIKSDISLARLVQAVRNFQDFSSSIDKPRMNILLSGAPGTGKTEFVKYLTGELGKKVIIKSAADLLDKYVGGTEQKIKRAFEQATEENAILFFDEIDALVQSRQRAQHSWQISQVNELLYQMENFNGVLIGATNFLQNIDAATLRRFTFKFEFDYLDNVGKKIFFERMFQSKLSDREEARLNLIENLAPGDFRTVRQGFYYLGNEVSNEERLQALEQETQFKIENKYRPNKVGFITS